MYLLTTSTTIKTNLDGRIDHLTIAEQVDFVVIGEGVRIHVTALPEFEFDGISVAKPLKRLFKSIPGASEGALVHDILCVKASMGVISHVEASKIMRDILVDASSKVGMGFWERLVNSIKIKAIFLGLMTKKGREIYNHRSFKDSFLDKSCELSVSDWSGDA